MGHQKCENRIFRDSATDHLFFNIVQIEPPEVFLFIRTSYLFITEENSKHFWNKMRSILLPRPSGGLVSSNASQVYNTILFGSNYLKKEMTKFSWFFQTTCKT